MKKLFQKLIYTLLLLFAGCSANSIDLTDNVYSPHFNGGRQLQAGIRAKPYDDDMAFNFGFAIDSSSAIIFSHQKIQDGDINCLDCNHFLKDFFEVGMGQHSVKLYHLVLEYYLGVGKGRGAWRDLIISQPLFSPEKLIRSETETVSYQKYFMQVTFFDTLSTFQNSGTIKLSYLTIKDYTFTDYNFETAITTIKNPAQINPVIMDIAFTSGINMLKSPVNLKLFIQTGFHYALKESDLTRNYFWIGAGLSLGFNF